MADTETPNATAQAISQIFEKTQEVDPRRLVREYELDSLRRVLQNSEKNAELMKGKKPPAGEVSPEELRVEAASQVAECEEALEEYDGMTGIPATITIGYIPEAVLTDYDLADQGMMSMEIGSREQAEALRELDKMLVKAGVKGHNGVMFKGVEVPYSECPMGLPSDAVLEVYSRAKWLRALRWAVYRHNSLAEEKKSR